MNAEDPFKRRENGRQERKAVDWVIFTKKSEQACAVKFWLSVLSNGCGNGVGSTGADAGTVGTRPVLAPELLAVDVPVGVVAALEGKSRLEPWPEPEPESCGEEG
jgi:hypothetical protein